MRTPASTRAARLTLKQANVLFAVISNGPVTAAAVAAHVRMTVDAARASLGRLEARALVAAQYTGTAQRARAYVETERGRAALAAADRDLDEDDEAEAICGRVLVGRGSDTYDPLCVEDAGHDGPCAPETRPA
jgi:DNA-binding MarR family transcriptional regulator